MIALVRVEVRRMLSRRLVRVIGILALAGIATGAVVTFVNSERPESDSAVLAAARAERESAIQGCVQGFGPGEEFGPGEFGAGAPDAPDVPGVQPLRPEASDDRRAFCERINPIESFVFDNQYRMTEFRDTAEGVGINLILLGLLLGATFIGAEWSNRTITTQLTWEPRRVRVLAAKVLALALTMFAASVVIEVVIGLSLLPAAAFRGTTAGADAAWLREVAGVVLRAGLLASFASAMAASLATVARNSAGALAIGFGYLAVFERLIAGFRPRWQFWLLAENVGVFITGRPATFETANYVLHRSVIEALGMLALYTAIILAAGATIFRRTDIA